MASVKGRENKREMVPFSQFDTLQKRLQMTDEAAADAIGYRAGSAISGWRRTGKAPLVAVIAMQAVSSKLESPADNIAVLRVTTEKRPGLELVFKSMGLPVQWL